MPRLPSETIPTASFEALTHDQLLATVFPYGQPDLPVPDIVVTGTFLITDPELQPPRRFHQTSSLTLISPSPDGKLLVPGVALGATLPLLNIRVATTRTMERTTADGREWAVWMRDVPVHYNTWRSRNAYSPSNAELYAGLTRHIKQTYQDILRGTAIDPTLLRRKLSEIGLDGFWLDDYAEVLPRQLRAPYPSYDAVAEVERLFVGFEDTLAMMGEAYASLSLPERMLLDEAFLLTFETTEPSLKLYIDDATADLPWVLRRDPRKIAAQPAGVAASQITAVYLPEEIAGTPLEAVAVRQLAAAGIDPRIILSNSILPRQCSSCLDAYGKFRQFDIDEMVATGQFVPILKAADAILKSGLEDY